jgi:hypothetical protein
MAQYPLSALRCERGVRSRRLHEQIQKKLLKGVYLGGLGYHKGFVGGQRLFHA